MYARPLFVVVGIFRVYLARFSSFRTAVLGLRLGIAKGCGYTLAA
jgi:hypothetical protein